MTPPRLPTQEADRDPLPVFEIGQAYSLTAQPAFKVVCIARESDSSGESYATFELYTAVNGNRCTLAPIRGWITRDAMGEKTSLDIDPRGGTDGAKWSASVRAANDYDLYRNPHQAQQFTIGVIDANGLEIPVICCEHSYNARLARDTLIEAMKRGLIPHMDTFITARP